MLRRQLFSYLLAAGGLTVANAARSSTREAAANAGDAGIGEPGGVAGIGEDGLLEADGRFWRTNFPETVRANRLHLRETLPVTPQECREGVLTGVVEIDTEAVQAAIDEGTTGGFPGKTVHIPCGVYLIGRPLHIPGANANGNQQRRMILEGDSRTILRAASPGISILVMDEDDLRHGSKILRSLKLDGNNLSGVTGLTVGDEGGEVLQCVTYDLMVTRCSVGVDLLGAMEHAHYGTFAYRNGVGVALRGFPSGGNNNQFYSLRCQQNKVGFFANRTAREPMHGNLFQGALFQQNSLCGVALCNTSQDWVFDTCHFEANGGGKNESMECFGRTLSRCSMFLDAATATVRGRFSEARVSPCIRLQNGATARLWDCGGYGNAAGTFVSADSLEETVELYGRFGLNGHIGANIARWPDRAVIGTQSSAVGMPVKSSSRLLRFAYAVEKPTIFDATGGARINNADDDGLLGAGSVASVRFDAAIGHATNHRVRIEALPDGVAVGDTLVIEALVRADAPTTIVWERAGGEDVTFPSRLDTEWRKLLLTFKAASSNSRPELTVYPSGDDAPKLYIAWMRTLAVPAGGNLARAEQMIAGLN